jgi:PAS domain S-box-containing protein
MKLFWKIYCAVLIAFVAVIALSSYVTSAKRISQAEKSIAEQHRIIGSLVSSDIEQSQRESKWPFESLRRLSEHHDFIFWWIVRQDGIVHLADKASFIGAHTTDYFSQVTGTFPDGEVFLNNRKGYGLFIKTFRAGDDRWTFWLGFSTKTVSRERESIISTTVMYSVAACLLLGLALYLTIVHFVNPVKDLAASAERIGKGDLDHRVEIKSNDELGYLACSFNKMAEDLKRTTASIDDLNREISDRVKAEDTLRKSENKYRTLIESLPQVIFSKDRNSIYISCNENYARDLGIRSEDVVGKTDYDFYPKELAEKYRQDDKRIMETGITGNIEERYIRQGQEMIVQTVKTPIRDEQGNISGVLGIFWDITERKKAEEALYASHQIIEGIINAISVRVFWKDKNLVYLGCNAIFARDAGFTDPKDIVGKDDYQMGWRDQAELYRSDDRQVIESGRPKLLIEEPQTTPEGNSIALLTSKIPLCDSKGEVIGVIGTYMDITERKNIEMALRKGEERFRQVVESAGDWIWEINVDGLYTYASPVVERVLGYKPEEIVGKKYFYDFFVPDVKEKLKKAAFEAFTDRKTFKGFVTPNIHKNGSTIIIETSGTPIIDEKGNLCGYRGADKDITERQQKEKELQKIHEELVSASHRAGMAEVAADVLHNVGNVLNSINVSTTLITEKVARSELANLQKVASIIDEHLEEIGTFITEHPQGKHIPVYLTEVCKCLQGEQEDIISKLRVLTGNVQHIKDIISMQQAYARISGVSMRASLGQLVEDAIQINSAGLQRHETRLIREFEELPDVEIDKQKVLQILVNLISNAKYALSDSKKAEKLLTIRIYKHGQDRLRIEVADNGVGISEKNLTKIFSHGFTTKRHGHGFGLHSGALAASEMGGSLTVHSDGVEQGATFTLELPFKPAKVVL